MNIIIPKETFPLEKRTMVLPKAAKAIVNAGHNLFVQAGAGSGLNILDREYAGAGATIISEPKDLYSQAQNGLIIKVKSPSFEEFSFIKKSILFCMLHSEQNREVIYHLGSQEIVGVAMETIRDKKGERIIDQTHITGEAGVYYALRHFQKMPQDTTAVILGYGHVATGAITACSKLGVTYKIIRREELHNLPLWLGEADLLINAIAWPKSERERKTYLVTRENIKNSKPGMIILDLAVDFPSPIETIHPTDYQNPYYLDEDRVHISIYGYPGLAPVTSSEIYSEQALPITIAIANNGGLEGIEKTGDLGISIQNAIISPSKSEWGKYRPLPPKGSNIE